MCFSERIWNLVLEFFLSGTQGKTSIRVIVIISAESELKWPFYIVLNYKFNTACKSTGFLALIFFRITCILIAALSMSEEKHTTTKRTNLHNNPLLRGRFYHMQTYVCVINKTD